MSAPAAPLVLIDGSSYLYRAFHALPPLTNSRGEPTGAVLGVLNMLQKFLREEAASPMVVVFDAPGRTFRDDLFAAYKAHRPPMPDDMRSQIQPLFDAMQALGLPMLRIPGVEADDVIGTLAVRAAASGRKVIISTGDKDMAQLVNDQITLVNTMTNTRLDRAGVKAKFDVWPEQIIDYLALVGDSSDNIPGIDKVGRRPPRSGWATTRTSTTWSRMRRRSAARWAKTCAPGSTRWGLSRQLATIRTNVELAEDPHGFARQPPDIAKLRELYTRLEFRALLRALDAEGGGEPAPPVAGGTAEPASVADTPATSLAAAPALPREYEDHPHRRSPAALVEAAAVGGTHCVRHRDHQPGLPRGTHRWHVLQRRGRQGGLPAPRAPLRRRARAARPGSHAGAAAALAGRRQPRQGRHHLKYDAHVLLNHGIALAGMRHDTMLESYVLNSVATRHDMDSVASHYLGIDTIKYEQVAGKGAKQIGFDQVPVETASAYAAEDADVTLRMHEALWPQLVAEPKLKALYEEIEQPLSIVLLAVEQRGVLIDAALLRRQSGELGVKLIELQKSAHAAAGGEFNLDSPKQLQQILFEKLQLPVLRKTPTGQPSTAEDVLEELADQFELPRLILEYRGLAKLKSTYTDKLPEEIDPQSGRVHTSYHQAIAATGRLSSTEPNLQNIPIRTAEGRRIRQAFIAPPGHVVMSADYSQIELRIMAHLSGDATLLRAFAEDRDVHQATAAEVLGKAIDAVTSEAPLGQGRELRPHLRHVGVRPCQATGHRPRRRAAVRGSLLRPLPRREGLHGPYPRAGARAGLRGNRARPATVPARHPLEEPPAAAVRRTQRNQRADAGHGGRHHQAGHAARGA